MSEPPLDGYACAPAFVDASGQGVLQPQLRAAPSALSMTGR